MTKALPSTARQRLFSDQRCAATTSPPTSSTLRVGVTRDLSTRTSTTATSMTAPTTHRPAREFPVASNSHPVTYGAPKPLVLPTELTTAMPAAAPAPVRNVLGRYQNTGRAQNTPTALTVTAIIVVSGDCMYRAIGMETAPIRVGMATCQILSPVRSECLLHNTIATAPTANGTATINPVVTSEKSVSNVFLKPATMLGRKKLSEYRP